MEEFINYWNSVSIAFYRGSFGLVSFLLAVSYFYFTFWQWKQEKRKRMEMAISGNELDYLPASRQSRRYRNSRLFESVLGPQVTQDELSFQAFTDKFTNFRELTEAMQTSGLEKCRLILGVDFTASNEWQGRRTFNRHCLHMTFQRGTQNPYQRVISTLGAMLGPFLETGLIHAFGFGDNKTRDHSVFSFRPDQLPCQDFADVFQKYTAISRTMVLAGPTSFAPITQKAIEIVKSSGGAYHILVLISDGQMGQDEQTVEAIVEASRHPLSIIMVGVGDGPWDRMEEYDDFLPMRRFDNFQFVDYHRSTAQGSKRNSETVFALHAMMELPDQFNTIKQLGYLKPNKATE